MKNLKDMCVAIREELGISQYALAEIIGTNQTEISFIERGFVPESQKKIEIIKHLYKIIKLRKEIIQ